MTAGNHPFDWRQRLPSAFEPVLARESGSGFQRPSAAPNSLAPAPAKRECMSLRSPSIRDSAWENVGYVVKRPRPLLDWCGRLKMQTVYELTNRDPIVKGT